MSATPRRIRRGSWRDLPGVFWAWPVDGYYDIHHAPEGVEPDGSDVVSEFHPTLADATSWVRDTVDLNVLTTGRI